MSEATGTSLHSICDHDYMSSEFQLLAEKVNQLAKLAHDLRNENAELRRQVKALTEENGTLNQRVDEAYARVVAVLDQLPVAPAPEAAESREEVA